VHTQHVHHGLPQNKVLQDTPSSPRTDVPPLGKRMPAGPALRGKGDEGPQGTLHACTNGRVVGRLRVCIHSHQLVSDHNLMRNHHINRAHVHIAGGKASSHAPSEASAIHSPVKGPASGPPSPVKVSGPPAPVKPVALSRGGVASDLPYVK
jgi:hypothetical protein